MKFFISIFLTFFCFLWFFHQSQAAININNIKSAKKIKEQSIGANSATVDPVKAINQTWEKILIAIKTVIWGLLVIYIVYAWIQMVISMWTDEDQLSSAKRQIWYCVIAFVFINIPGTIYNSFNSSSGEDLSAGVWYTSWFSTPSFWDSWNIFINAYSFGQTLNWDIIWFIQVILSALAVAVILLASIKILTSRGQEENITESKNKIIWSVISLLLVWFIESWKYFVYKGKISDGENMFESLINLATFFAWPIAIWFITYAWYLFITANGNDDQVNKAKSIITNVLLATVILLAWYTFLLDLITL